MYSAAVPNARPLRWPLNSQTRWPRSNRVTPAPTCSISPAPSLFGITRSNSIALIRAGAAADIGRIDAGSVQANEHFA